MNWSLTFVVADKVCESDDLRKTIRRSGAKPVISSGKGSRRRRCDNTLYKLRNAVERFFGRLKHYWRVPAVAAIVVAIASGSSAAGLANQPAEDGEPADVAEGTASTAEVAVNKPAAEPEPRLIGVTGNSFRFDIRHWPLLGKAGRDTCFRRNVRLHLSALPQNPSGDSRCRRVIRR